MNTRGGQRLDSIASPRSLVSGHARRFSTTAPSLARRTGTTAPQHTSTTRLAAARARGDATEERALAIDLAGHLELLGLELGVAAELYSRAADLQPEAAVLLVLAALEERLGRPARAADALERALTLGPTSGAHLRLGWLRLRAGQVRDAVQVLVEAAAASQEPRALEWIGALGFFGAEHAAHADAAEAYVNAAIRAAAAESGAGRELEELARALALAPSPSLAERFAVALARNDERLADAFRETFAFSCEAPSRAPAFAALASARAARADLPGLLVLALDPTHGGRRAESFDDLLLRVGLPAVLAEQLALRAAAATGDERCRLLVERMRVLAGPLSDGAAAARAAADVLAHAPAEPEALSRLAAYAEDGLVGAGALAVLAERLARAEGPLGELAESVAKIGERTQNPGLMVVGLRAALLNGDTAKLRERLAAAEARCEGRLAPPSSAAPSPEWRRDRVRVLGVLSERREEWARDVDAYVRVAPWAADVMEFAVERAIGVGDGERALAWARAGLANALGSQRVAARSLLARAELAFSGPAAALQALLAGDTLHPEHAPQVLLLGLEVGDRHAVARAAEALALATRGAVAAAFQRASARAYLGAGDLVAGRRMAERALALEPAEPLAAALCCEAWAHTPRVFQGPGQAAAALALVERAASLLWPDAARAGLLVELATLADDHRRAAAWGLRWIGLRPGDVTALRAYLSALVAAGGGEPLCEALGWLPSAPYAGAPLGEALAGALRALTPQPSLLAAAARGLFEALGASQPPLRDALLEAASLTADHAFAAEVLERALSCDAGGAAREGYVRLAELCDLAGRPEWEVRALAAAVRHGAVIADLEARLDRLAPSGARPLSGDAELLWLRLAADRAPNHGAAEAALAGRRLGAALWDIAGDASGALAAWVQAARRAPLRGYTTLRRDLVEFAGADEALECLVALGEHEPEVGRAASLLSEGARVALTVGDRARAFQLAALALSRNPAHTDVLTSAEAGVVSEAEEEPLSELYTRVAANALGRFGRRAAHYRAARFFQGRGAHRLAIGHATQAFLAVPSQGSALQLLARAGVLAGDPLAVFHAIEQLTAITRSPAQRAAWLVRAADLGDQTTGTVERVDALVRSFVLVPDAETLAKLAVALRREMAASPGEVEGLLLRFVRAVRAVLPKCEGPEGARVAVRLTDLALELTDDAELAWDALTRGLACDGDIDEYRSLVPIAPRLVGADCARAGFAAAVAVTEKPYASLGWAAYGLLGVLALQFGERALARRLLVGAVSRDADDDLYVVLADEALSDSEDAADRKKLDRSVDATRLAEALTRVLAGERAVGDANERRRLARLAQVLPGGLAASERRRLAELDPPASTDPFSIALVRERIGADDFSGALAAAGGQGTAALLQVADAAEAAGHHSVAAVALEQLSTAAATPDVRVDALRRLGRSFDAHDPARAEGYWRGVVEALPLDEEADLALEDLLLRSGKYAEVADHLGVRAARFARDPSRRESLRALRLRRAALLEQRLGRPAEARAELEALLLEEPTSKSALRYLADLTERHGDRVAMVAVLERLRDLDPTDLETCDEAELRIARVDLLEGRDEAARARVMQVLARSEHAEATELLVGIARRSGEPRELGDALERYARASAEEANARGDLLVEAAQAALAAGELDVALRRAREAARVAPAMAAAHVLARSIEYRTRGIGTPDEARTTLAELSAHGAGLAPPEQVVRAFLIGASTRLVHGPARAIAVLQHAVGELGPQALLSFGLAEHHIAEGRYGEALSAYDDALAGTLHGLHQTTEVAILASAAAEASGDVPRAIRYAERAAEDPTTRIAALERSRRLAGKLGDVGKERSFLRKLVSLQSGDARLEAARDLARSLLASPSAEDHEEARDLHATLPETTPSSRALSEEIRSRLAGLEDEGGRSTMPAPEPVLRAMARFEATPARAAEVRAAEVRAVEVRAAEVRAPEVRAPEVRAPEPRVRLDPATLSNEAIEAFLRAGKSVPAPPVASSADPFPQDTVRDPFAAERPATPQSAPPPDPEALATLPSLPVEVFRAVQKGTLPDARGDASYAEAQAHLAGGRRGAAEGLLVEALCAGSADAADLLAGVLEADPQRRTLAMKARRLAAELSPGDPRRLAALCRAAVKDQNANQARSLQHLLACFEGGPVPPPPPLQHQSEQPGMLEFLTRPGRSGLGEAFKLVWEHASPVLVRNAGVSVDGLERLLPGEASTTGEIFGEVVRLLGVRKPRLYQGRVPGAPSARPLLVSPPAGVLDGSLTDSSPELGFLIGEALGGAQPPQALLLGQPLAEARKLFRAMLGAFGPSVGAVEIDRHTAELGEVLWQTLPARAQRRLSDLLAQTTRASFDEAFAAARQAALRVGLFVSGDFRQAARAVLVEAGQDPRLASSPGAIMDLTSELPALADLYRLALRPEYADARFFLSGGARMLA